MKVFIDFLHRNGSMKIPILYLHRLLRLIPLLAASLLFSTSLLKFFGSGPLWSISYESFRANCGKYWWSTLLYAQNYLNPDEIVRRNYLFKIAFEYFC